MNYLIAGLAILIMISGCGCTKNTNQEDVEISSSAVLADIAFDSSSSAESRVYIKENGEYTPFLVLTKDYYGSCLLIREFLQNENKIYSDVSELNEKPSYYEGSTIDEYLNGEYVKLFDANFASSIVNTPIIITAKESIGVGGKETTLINRKVFLLSYSELNAESSRTNLSEGPALSYFSSNEMRISYYENGEAGSWWLRTPNTGDRILVCGVSDDGLVGIGGIYNPNQHEGNYNGVRPAFCLSSTTVVEREAVNGAEAFVIK